MFYLFFSSKEFQDSLVISMAFVSDKRPWRKGESPTRHSAEAIMCPAANRLKCKRKFLTINNDYLKTKNWAIYMLSKDVSLKYCEMQ